MKASMDASESDSQCPNRRPALQDCVAYDKHIHLSTKEAVQCLHWTTNNWFVFIKRCVQHHRYSSRLLKGVYQPMILGICSFRHRL